MENVAYARVELYDDSGRRSERWVEGRGLSNMNSNNGGTWAAEQQVSQVSFSNHLMKIKRNQKDQESNHEIKNIS